MADNTRPPSPTLSTFSTFSNLSGISELFKAIREEALENTDVDLKGLLSPQDPEHLQGSPPEDLLIPSVKNPEDPQDPKLLEAGAPESPDSQITFATLAQALAEENQAEGPLTIVVEPLGIDNSGPTEEPIELPIEPPEPIEPTLEEIPMENQSLAAGQEDQGSQSHERILVKFKDAVKAFGEIYYIEDRQTGKKRFVVPPAFQRIKSRKPAVFPEQSVFNEFNADEMKSGYKNPNRTCMAFFTMTGKPQNWTASKSLLQFEENPNKKCKGSSTGAGNGCSAESCKKLKTLTKKDKLVQLWFEYANAVFKARVPVQEYTEEDTA